MIFHLGSGNVNSATIEAGAAGAIDWLIAEIIDPPTESRT